MNAWCYFPPNPLGGQIDFVAIIIAAAAQVDDDQGRNVEVEA